MTSLIWRKTFTVSFFGHRKIAYISQIEVCLRKVVSDLIIEKEYVEFLVGRNGAFDQLAASTIRWAKRTLWDENNALVLVLPYLTTEYLNNEQPFNDYYDEVELCQSSAEAHFKDAIQVCNHEMVERSDLIICCIKHNSGDTYQTVQYAKRLRKQILNLAHDNLCNF